MRGGWDKAQTEGRIRPKQGQIRCRGSKAQRNVYGRRNYKTREHVWGRHRMHIWEERVYLNKSGAISGCWKKNDTIRGCLFFFFSQRIYLADPNERGILYAYVYNLTTNEISISSYQKIIWFVSVLSYTAFRRNLFWGQLLKKTHSRILTHISKCHERSWTVKLSSSKVPNN